jgi:PEP-CTERM motif
VNFTSNGTPTTLTPSISGLSLQFCDTATACINQNNVHLNSFVLLDIWIPGFGATSNGVNEGGTTGLVEIAQAVATTPLPATLPLFASGLGALGLLGWRRKRKNASAIAA